MSISIKDTLAAKGVHPSDEHLAMIAEMWQGYEQLKGDLAGVDLDAADISLVNIAGDDHHEQHE